MGVNAPSLRLFTYRPLSTTSPSVPHSDEPLGVQNVVTTIERGETVLVRRRSNIPLVCAMHNYSGTLAALIT